MGSRESREVLAFCSRGARMDLARSSRGRHVVGHVGSLLRQDRWPLLLRATAAFGCCIPTGINTFEK